VLEARRPPAPNRFVVSAIRSPGIAPGDREHGPRTICRINWPTTPSALCALSGANASSYDAWLFFPATDGAAVLAHAVPDLPTHSEPHGGLLRVGPYADRDDEVLGTWRSE